MYLGRYWYDVVMEGKMLREKLDISVESVNPHTIQAITIIQRY